MNRRNFLRALGLAGASAAVAACTGAESEAQSAAPAAARSTAPLPAFDPVGRVTDADEVLSVVAATYEQLVAEQVPFAFGVLDVDNAPVDGVEIVVHVVPLEGEPSGPYPATSVEDPSGRGGLHLAEIPLTEAGPTSVVAVTADGRAGAATVPVATPESSAFPAPGAPAPVVATPTTDAPLGADRVCTLDPPCGMHEVSLDEALAAGRPVVLEFATPEYCQTALCGPSVDVLEQVRQGGAPGGGDWGDVAFVHCEIYADAGQTLLDAVTQWNLPSEPWLYVIDSSGAIVERTDGPLLTLPDRVQQIAARAV